MLLYRTPCTSTAEWAAFTIPAHPADFARLTLSPPIRLRLYTLPYWSNPPFLIFDIRALWRSPERQSVRMSKIKNSGLDQYGAEPFEQQQFETADVEGVNQQPSVGWAPSVHAEYRCNSLHNSLLFIFRVYQNILCTYDTLKSWLVAIKLSINEKEPEKNKN